MREAPIDLPSQGLLNLALGLKRIGSRADQAQAFCRRRCRSPARCTIPARTRCTKSARNVPDIAIPRSMKQRKLHKTLPETVADSYPPWFAWLLEFFTSLLGSDFAKMPVENSPFKKCQLSTFAKKDYQAFDFNGTQAVINRFPDNGSHRLM